MPSPARSTGTSSGGCATRTPSVGPTGVVIGTRSTSTARVASYTSIEVSSRSAARNMPGSVAASRRADNRVRASG